MRPEEKIRWTKAEWLQLAEECLKRNGYGAWRVSPVAAIRAVQTILPKDRQRSNMKGADNIKPLAALLSQLRARGPVLHAPAPPVLPPAPSPALPPESIPVRDMLPRAGPSFSLSPERTVTDVLSTFLADVLVESVKKLLTNGDIARMLRSLQNGVLPQMAVDSAPRHNPMGMSAPREKKLECLVCGFKGHQQSEINTRTAQLGRLHIRFWYAESSNENLTVLKHKAESSDVVLFTMEASSHNAVDVVKSMHKRIIRVTGGMTTMLEMLQKLQDEQLLDVQA